MYWWGHPLMGWPPIKGKLYVTETGLSSDLMDNLLTCSILYIPAIGDKIVETLYLNRVTSENKRIHTPPIPCHLHSKLGCLLFSIGGLKSGTTAHGGAQEEKLYFPLLKSVQCKKAQFRAKLLNSFCCWLSESTRCCPICTV